MATMAFMLAAGFLVTRSEAADTVKVKGCTGTRVTLSVDDKTMLVKHNRARANRGLKKLCIHPKLQRAAEAHSQDMIRRDYFSHNSKNGSSPYKCMKREGYRFRYAGENIAYGSDRYGAPGRIFKNWMKSSGYRHNILERKLREVGIAAVTGNYKGTKNTTMWSVDFGTR